MTSTTTTKPNPIPPGPRLLPHLSVRNPDKAIAFYVAAFGATETLRLVEPNGRIAHAELSFEGTAFMLADEYPDWGSVGPETLGGASLTLHVYVADVDAFVARAVSSGAELTRPVADQFYGDRAGSLKDPFGHKWTFSSRIEELSSAEMQTRMNAMMAKSEPKKC